jgi:iron complex outermembrane recepter protein
MNPKHIIRLALGLLTLFVNQAAVAQPATASQPTGTVTGRVLNQATGDYLEGARIELGNQMVTSGRGGTYRLQLPAGMHQLTVSYTGLDRATVPVQVDAGRTLTRDVALTSGVYAMEAFTVAGDREGSALAITLQREAPNVMNVVAVDHFGRPNANPADLLQRLPGVVGDITGSEIRDITIRGISGDFNAVTIDGNSMADSGSAGVGRAMQFQHLTTSNVENIELTKAPTPDMNADAIGGRVNLVTTSILDRPPRRTISYSVGTSYRVWDKAIHRLKDRIGLDEFRFRYSDVFSVFGAENNLGVTFTAGYRTPIIHVDYTYHQHQANVPSPDTPRYQWELSTREFQSNERRMNASLRFDYRISETTRVFINTMYNRRQEWQKIWRFWWATASNGNAIRPGYSQAYTEATTGTVTLQALTLDKHGRSYNVNPGGVTELGRLKLEYDAFENYSKTFYPNSDDLQVQLPNVGGIIDRRNTGMWDPVWTPTGPNAADVFNLSKYRTVANGLVNDQNLAETWQRGAKLDARWNPDLPLLTYVKAGAKVSEMEKETARNQNRWAYPGVDLGRFYDRNYGYSHYNGKYPVMPFPGLPERGGDWDIKHVLRTEPHLFRQNAGFNAQQRHVWDRYVRERVTGGYMMTDTRYQRFSVLGGLRVEKTDVKGRGYLQMVTPEERARRAAWVGPVTDTEAIRRANEEYGRRQTSSGEYTNVFPSLHVRYRPARNLLARASYSTGIGRPPLGSIIPLDTVNFDTQIVSRSNPSLKPRTSDNFDVSLEYYFEPVGMLSVGLFRKEIKNFHGTLITSVGTGNDNGFDGDFAGWELRTTRNLGRARVQGVEVNYQQQFTFLPGWLKGFGVYANLTKLETKGNPASGSAATGRVANFIPTSANGGISYRNFGFSGALQATHVGKYYESASSIPSNELWRMDRTTVEFRGRYTINRFVDVYFDVYNIFNEPIRPRVRGGPAFNHPAEINLEGVSFAAGISGRF